jgi:hypothetical protein
VAAAQSSQPGLFTCVRDGQATSGLVGIPTNPGRLVRVGQKDGAGEVVRRPFEWRKGSRGLLNAQGVEQSIVGALVILKS